jgi:hypothetical protein
MRRTRTLSKGHEGAGWRPGTASPSPASSDPGGFAPETPLGTRRGAEGHGVAGNQNG